MDYDTASIFDTLLEPIKRAGVEDTTYSMFIDKVRFRSGVYDIGVSRFMGGPGRVARAQPGPRLDPRRGPLPP